MNRCVLLFGSLPLVASSLLPRPNLARSDLSPPNASSRVRTYKYQVYARGSASGMDGQWY